MSDSYWMGYHCDGLFLSYDEADKVFIGLKNDGLLKRAPGQRGGKETDLNPEEFEGEDFDLVTAINNGEINAYSENGKRIWIVTVDEDISDGACFGPYEEDVEGFDREYGIIVGLDNQPEWYRAAYNTIEEMVREMHDKLAKYLPADFPWKARLGHFRCAFHA